MYISENDVWFNTFMTLLADIFQPHSRAYAFSCDRRTTEQAIREFEVKRTALIRFVERSAPRTTLNTDAEAFLVVDEEGDTLDVYLGPTSARKHCPPGGDVIPLYR